MSSKGSVYVTLFRNSKLHKKPFSLFKTLTFYFFVEEDRVRMYPLLSTRADGRYDCHLVSFLYHSIILAVFILTPRHIHVTQVYRDQAVIKHSFPNALVPLLECVEEFPQGQRRRQSLHILARMGASTCEIEDVEVALWGLRRAHCYYESDPVKTVSC